MAKDEKLDNIQDPSTVGPADPPLIHNLTIAATALTTASIAVNVILQVARYLNKPPVEPDQRDRAQAAGLALSVLRQMPGLIKQVRVLANQVRRTA